MFKLMVMRAPFPAGGGRGARRRAATVPERGAGDAGKRSGAVGADGPRRNRNRDFHHWRRWERAHRIAGVQKDEFEAVLKWIVGSKAEHPLADVKHARALVAGLPAHDSVKALAEIRGWLESVIGSDSFRLERLYELVDRFDSAARNHQRKLVQDYLLMPRQQKFHENKLWTAGAQFAKILGDAYSWILEQYEAGASGAAAVRRSIPSACARAMRARAHEVKWAMLRYGAFDPRIWTSMAQLHRLSVNGAFEDVPIAIYPGLHGQGTVRHEFLKALMLWASSADVLPPVRQDIAERVVAAYASSFVLRPEAFPGALYTFDPAQVRPPARLFSNPSVPEGAHYFGPGDAHTRLTQAIALLEESGVMPSDLNLGQTYPPEAVLAVLKHLALYWGDKPPARLSERRATTGRITVVPGFTALLDELEREESDALNFTESAAESWIVENVSDNGFGAIVPPAASDWIRVGELIGVQVEGSTGWGVSIIRRVARDEQRQYRVGIEVIARTVAAVSLARASGEPEHAILLSTRPDGNGEVALIRSAGRYDSRADARLVIRDHTYSLSPSRLIDAGEGFDWASYKIGRAV
jgi:hypothetical protein